MRRGKGLSLLCGYPREMGDVGVKYLGDNWVCCKAVVLRPNPLLLSLGAGYFIFPRCLFN